jgi:hypothetical protein
MNKRQQNVLICTAAVIAAMVLFPPYVAMSKPGEFDFSGFAVHRSEARSQPRSQPIGSGYGFLFDLPEESYWYAALDPWKLIVQIAAALIVGLLVYFALRDIGTRP